MQFLRPAVDSAQTNVPAASPVNSCETLTEKIASFACRPLDASAAGRTRLDGSAWCFLVQRPGAGSVPASPQPSGYTSRPRQPWRSAAVSDSMKIVDRWVAGSAALRSQRPKHLDLAHGAGERNNYDLFPADNPTTPCWCSYNREIANIVRVLLRACSREVGPLRCSATH